MFRGASFLLFLNWLCIVIWLISSFEATDATIVVLATNDSYVDRTAAFGPRIPEDGIILSLVAIETLDGSDQSACRPVKGGPANMTWVALVERGGNCSFVAKVRNMQESGAAAVIVGDNQRNGLITMYAREDTSDVLIPSVFIAQHHYRELRYLGMELGKEYLVKLTPDDMQWPVLDVIIFIILSPAFVVLFLYFMWRVRLHQQQVADLAPTEVVSNLPIKVFYRAKLQENDPVECVICLEDYEDEDELRVLPCKHQYHVACIDNWLTTRKRFCPICKRDICASETTPLLGGNTSSSNNQRRNSNNNNNNNTSSTPPTPNSGSSSSSRPSRRSRSSNRRSNISSQPTPPRTTESTAPETNDVAQEARPVETTSTEDEMHRRV